MITIVGLGPGASENLTLGAWQELTGDGRSIWLRTARHPVADYLKAQGLQLHSFDHYYKNATSFEEVYQSIATFLVDKSLQGESLVYAVPGNPQVAEESVRIIVQRASEAGASIKLLAGMSSLEAVYSELQVDPTQGMMVADALQQGFKADPRLPLIVTQVYSRLVASELKLSLLEIYPPEHVVQIVTNAGAPGSSRVSLPLYQLDHREYSYADTIYVPPCNDLMRPGDWMEDLAAVMARLRDDDGCPWDREQTHQSLRPYLLEETYEVLEAIDEGNEHKLAEELGDLLLQIVFHSQIAAENGDFRLGDPIRLITEKLIRRHPHIFADTKVKDSGEVVANWQKIKQQERNNPDQSSLDAVSRTLPALMEAAKVQARARDEGFDWPDIQGPLDKVQEELAELMEASHNGDAAGIMEELGDLLFAVVNVARFLKVEPENALRLATAKFRQRFGRVRILARERGIDMTVAGIEALDVLWEETK